MTSLYEFLAKKHLSTLKKYDNKINLSDIKDGDYFVYEFINYKKHQIIVLGKCKKIINTNYSIDLYPEFYIRKLIDENGNQVISDKNWVVILPNDSISFGKDYDLINFRTPNVEEQNMLEKIESKLNSNKELHIQVDINNKLTFN